MKEEEMQRCIFCNEPIAPNNEDGDGAYIDGEADVCTVSSVVEAYYDEAKKGHFYIDVEESELRGQSPHAFFHGKCFDARLAVITKAFNYLGWHQDQSIIDGEHLTTKVMDILVPNWRDACGYYNPKTKTCSFGYKLEDCGFYEDCEAPECYKPEKEKIEQ